MKDIVDNELVEQEDLDTLDFEPAQSREIPITNLPRVAVTVSSMTNNLVTSEVSIDCSQRSLRKCQKAFDFVLQRLKDNPDLLHKQDEKG